ncbi:MAG: zf-HC2 domain-containing protein [Bryobacteraceae bacterium]
MVTCKDFLRELSDFLDESVDPALRQELERHISQCPNCWVICDTTKKTIQVYKGMDAEPLPEAVHSKLVQIIEQHCGKREPQV